MNKSKFLGIFLSTVAVLSLGSCSGDEFTTTEAGQQGERKAVSFTATRAMDETKKTYYGTLGNGNTAVFWSNNDKFTFFSPASARWTAQTGVYTSNFTHVSGDVVGWNVGDPMQHFYLYYPANSPYITGIGEEDGSATFSVPTDQSAMAMIIPEDELGAANPLSFSMAAKKNVGVDPDAKVSFSFNDFMNVLRMRITNPNRHTIKAIEVVSATAGQKVAGTVLVTPITTTYYDFDIAATGSNAVTVGAQGRAPAAMLDIYLLPQDYTNGVTINITYNDGVSDKERTGTTSSFPQGTIKMVEFDLPASVPVVIPAQSVDMGIMVVSNVAADGTVTTSWIGKADGTYAWEKVNETAVHSAYRTLEGDEAAVPANAKPLYFAEGNVIVKKDGTGRIGAKGEISQATTLWSMEYNTFLTDNTYERDLFGWADITGWKTPGGQNNIHLYPSSTPPRHISGNPLYDIARATVGGNSKTSGWRLPTVQELAFLMGRVADTPSNTVSAFLSSGSYTISTFNGITGLTAISKITNEELFFPAASVRAGHNLQYPGVGFYWSGTLMPGDGLMDLDYNAYRFRFNNPANEWQTNATQRAVGNSVRPVIEGE